MLGRVIGPVAAFYGVVALLMGKTFLPGYQVHALLIGGRPGTALAAGYLAGGIYLVLRFHVERRPMSESTGRHVYTAETLLLTVFIASLVYALLHVGALA